MKGKNTREKEILEMEKKKSWLLKQKKNIFLWKKKYIYIFKFRWQRPEKCLKCKTNKSIANMKENEKDIETWFRWSNVQVVGVLDQKKQREREWISIEIEHEHFPSRRKLWDSELKGSMTSD